MGAKVAHREDRGVSRNALLRALPRYTILAQPPVIPPTHPHLHAIEESVSLLLETAQPCVRNTSRRAVAIGFSAQFCYTSNN